LYEEKSICENHQICVNTCGGTLLDRFHVLTAAHCIGKANSTTILVTAGVHNKQNIHTETRQVRRVDRIFLAPEWNAQTLANDLAILRLSEPVEFNRYVQAACLPGPEPQPNSEAIIIGWGANRVGGTPNNQLKQARMKIIGQCYKYWNQFDNDNQLCAGQTVSGDSACQGDSGGPLLQKYNGQWIVQGVVSYIDECRTNDHAPPNIYVKVSAYMSWIEKTIR
jgi:secreted trypsin-like serine protease